MGDTFQKIIENYIDDTMLIVKSTNASGQVHSNGDTIISFNDNKGYIIPPIMLDYKFTKKESKSFSIKKDEIDKVNSDAIKRDMNSAIVSNLNEKVYITMNLKDFIEILEDF